MIVERKKLTMGLIAVLMLLVLAYVFSSFGDVGVKLPGYNRETDNFFYKQYYDGVLTGGYFEKGYQFTARVFHSLGFTFNVFKFVMFVLSMVLVGRTICKYNYNYAFLVILYALSAYPKDLEQIRSFFAMSIVIFALPYLFDERPSVIKIIKYLVCIAVAMLFHNSAVFFALFLLVPLLRDTIVVNWLYLIITCACIAIKFLPFSGSLISRLAFLVTNNDRTDMWFSFSAGMSFYLCVCLHGILLFAIHRQNRKTKWLINNGVSYENWSFVNFGYQSLQVMSFVFPMYLFSSEFFRMYRSMLVFYFAVILEQAAFIDEHSEMSLGDEKRKGALVIIAFTILYLVAFKPFSVIINYYQAIGGM